MKIEKLRRFNIWKVMCIFLFISVVILVISLKTSKASYRVTASYPAAYGTINWKVGDVSIIAINIEQESGTYLESEDFPTSGYALNNAESYCILSVNGEQVKQDVSMSYANNTFSVIGLTKKGTKCFLYFDRIVALNTILAQNTVDTSRKSGGFTSAFTSNTAGTIYVGPEDNYGSTTYFFAGANPNNWVYFAGFYWRIIRVNGDGSLRLIYNGTDTTTTGTGTRIGTSVFNSSYNDNAYVGYMYTLGFVHGFGTSSTIKVVLDNWYASNIANNSNYLSKISSSAGFCGDRRPSTSSTSFNGSGGTGTTSTKYAPSFRVSSATFEYYCFENDDLYTVGGVSKGNNALTYPIGLITIDEAIAAGSYGGYQNTYFYLYTGNSYITMSPYNFNGSEAAAPWAVGSQGQPYAGNSMINNWGVRPVINIKGNIELTGTGTSTDPYIPI